MMVPLTFTTNVCGPYISVPVTRLISSIRSRKRIRDNAKTGHTFDAQHKRNANYSFLIDISGNVSH